MITYKMPSDTVLPSVFIIFCVSALSLGGHADAARPCLNSLARRVQEGKHWIHKGSSWFYGKPEQDPFQHILLMVPRQLSE